MINFEPFFAELDNDVESINIVLSTYLEEYEDGHVQVKELFDTQSWAELFILVHSLKGILANFGEQEIIPVLEEIEAQTQKNSATEQILVDKVCSILVQVQLQIKQELLKVA
ncbi:MAG: Hpt domain-containing protein [Alteromonadales bacterium]|nr:Hpt domain-containing protein [Alteromonadales bacterium]